MNPLFSIITVTYNAARTLPPTLRSVAGQTCRLFEHLVIDGASTDGTQQLVADAGIKETVVYSETDKGLYDAMNKGLALAKGEYVIFLNAGDSFHSPDTLQTIANAIMDNDFPGIVYGQTDIVDADRRRIGERHLRAPERLTLKSFANGMVVCHQAFVALQQFTDFADHTERDNFIFKSFFAQFDSVVALFDYFYLIHIAVFNYLHADHL